MRQDAAFRVAIDLFHAPERVRSLRGMPLPNDIADVLRVAAGEHEVAHRVAEATGRSEKTINDAAIFYIEQLMFYPGADSYRVLGAAPTATHDELRHSMALLLRWLHPDRAAGGEHAVFVSRVTQAWDTLKTEERRAQYDHLVAMAEKQKASHRNGRNRPRQRGKARKNPTPQALRQTSRQTRHAPQQYPQPQFERRDRHTRVGPLRQFLIFVFRKLRL